MTFTGMIWPHCMPWRKRLTMCLWRCSTSRSNKFLAVHRLPSSPSSHIPRSFHYKSMLISQSNGNPYLSKDRLTRMKNPIYHNNSDAYLTTSSFTTSMLLGLRFDVGVYFKDMQGSASTMRATRKKKTKGRSTTINSGFTNGIFYMGRVLEN